MDKQRFPKKEEQEEDDQQRSSTTFEFINGFSREDDFGINIDSLSCSHELTWDFWGEDDGNDDEEEKCLSSDQEGSSFGFWDNTSTDYEDKELSLKLNLNHQEVIDAWSDRQQMAPANALYRGEVPVMDEEKNMRREASVLRYKEKRQSRLFSKKIRYQVRKLNADKRPRFKGRFVKREA